MFTILVMACLAHTDDCRPTVVAGGLLNERQCLAYKRLMVEGWKAIHPTIEVRRDLCTATPELVIGKFQT